MTDCDFKVKYYNNYKCVNCETEWDDIWDSGCDDECPKCGTVMTPFTSVELC